MHIDDLPFLSRLYQKNPDPEILWTMKRRDYQRVSKATTKRINRLLQQQTSISIEDSKRILSDFAASRITTLCPADSAYPDTLRTIHEPPVLLYCRGNTELLHSTVRIAVVGTRKPTTYGETAANDLIATMRPFNSVIVSGLALGIDAIAHRAALKETLPTIAVLGSPITHITPPRNTQLGESIIEHDGLIISEYPPNSRVRPEWFPLRNRIIAGLSQTILIIEAAEKSGSLITARLGAEENRDVFAVPGSIYSTQSAGTNQLIEFGTPPISSLSQFIVYLNERFGGDSDIHTPALSATPMAHHPILAIFIDNAHTLSIEEIAERTFYESDALFLEISQLEIAGAIRMLPDGRFQKT